jgi:uncharacterized protein
LESYENIIKPVQLWLETIVIGLNLCPFAKRDFVKNKVRFSVTESNTEEQLLSTLQTELELLEENPAIETTLLIHPMVLSNFFDYNQFLNSADSLLVSLKMEGIFQIASFHPDYQFSGTEYDEVENYTNRSPYPLLHLLREESVELAITGYKDHKEITERNIQLLKSLGRNKMQDLLQSCFRG